VVGASGDLARKKIFPALFALYYEGMLPEVIHCHLCSDVWLSGGDIVCAEENQGPPRVL
jgi:Glucose-6-phosphate dehydrogenase, NAD binding domain